MLTQQKRYLKTGDLVLLFSEEAEEEGYVSSGGTTDDRCVIKSFKDKGLSGLKSILAGTPFFVLTCLCEWKERSEKYVRRDLSFIP
jgi:hypothetical protein